MPSLLRSCARPLFPSVDSGSLCPLLELILLTQPIAICLPLEIAPIKVTTNFVSLAMIETLN